MDKLRNLIPSANALFAFEAAARLKSFTLAARELNVSQPAISHAIKTLEKSLGKQLFHRSHRRIELTGQGRNFYRDITAGLEHIYFSAQELLQGDAQTSITISGSTLFIHYWMIPRLRSFELQFPDVTLKLHSTDRDVSLLSEGIDISVRLGNSNWPDYDVSFFADEIIYPVCSPDYSLEHSGLDGDPDLLQHRLLYVDEPFRIRMTWRDWFRDAGQTDYQLPKGVFFNDAQLCLQAALTGQGVALGWHHICAPMVQEGTLIRAAQHTYIGHHAMYLITPKETQTSSTVSAVRDWLLQQMNQSLSVEPNK